MLPERFGRYEVLAEIGDGAMGRVYSAWDPKVSRVVAVKTIKAELLTSDTAADYLKRFRREAQAAGSLNHPQVVRVFDIGEDFLVMEFVLGQTLRALIRGAGRVSPEDTLRLLGPIADALDHAHRAGIVHRDIKPANVMVEPSGQPKLMDFGVAHLAASVMTTAGQVLGSPSYMAPEQIAGLEVTGRCDVYSLAVVAYEMLTGQPPFQGRTITQVIHRVMHEPAPPPRQLNAALPARYDDVFARGLVKEPTLRFASAGEFVAALDLRELEWALAPAPAPARTPEAATSAIAEEVATLLSGALPVAAVPSVPRRSRVPPLLVTAAVALVAAIGWAAIGRGPNEPTPLASPAPPAGKPGTPAPTAATVPGVGSSAISPAAPSLSANGAPATRRGRSAPGVATASPPAIPPEPEAGPSPTPEPVAEGQLVELTDDVTPPVRTHGAPAPYPDRARALRQHGTVAVSMIVDETGAPTELSVVESAGAVLDAAVLENVRGWRFEPARKGGVRVRVRWTARQTYREARP